MTWDVFSDCSWAPFWQSRVGWDRMAETVDLGVEPGDLVLNHIHHRPHQERVNRPFCPRLQPSIELVKDPQCLTPPPQAICPFPLHQQSQPGASRAVTNCLI